MKTFLKLFLVLAVIAMTNFAVANAPPAELDTGNEFAIMINQTSDASAVILQSADNYVVSGIYASIKPMSCTMYESISQEGVVVPTIRSGVNYSYSYLYNTTLSQDSPTRLPYIEWLQPEFLRRV